MATAAGTGGDGGRRNAAQIANAPIASATSPPMATGNPDGMIASFSRVPDSSDRRGVDWADR